MQALSQSPLAAQDHFTLLGLPRQFKLDSQLLESSWKRVVLAVHPDRFATRSAAEKRVAMQWSSQANEAYRILKDPLSRARYLCELANIDVQSETNTAMSSAFLLRQMDWHEQLDALSEQGNDKGKESAYQALYQELSDVEQEIAAAVNMHLDEKRYDLAASRVREWMFINKLIAQIHANH